LLLAVGAYIHLLLLEQLHSEDIWHKVFLHSDKLTKPFVKAHGQHLIHLSGWSTFALLVVAVEVLVEAAVAEVVLVVY
jgi:hypothetical protein